MERNYRIVSISPQKTVVIEVAGERRDTGVRPTDWGLIGLPSQEQRILLRGMTRREREEARGGGA